MAAYSSTGTNSSYFRGAMDDVRYYANKTLSAAEVWAIYNKGTGTEAENPVIDNTSPPPVNNIPRVSSPYGHFKMNDDAPSPTVWDDAIGMNDGVLSVNTQVIHDEGKIKGGLNFNGTSHYANMDSLLTDIKVDSVGTFTMWVKPEPAAGSPKMLSVTVQILIILVTELNMGKKGVLKGALPGRECVLEGIFANVIVFADQSGHARWADDFVFPTERSRLMQEDDD